MENKRLNILFVSSGNSKNGISPIIMAQRESLKENDVNIEYYTIKGKGIKGYVTNILPLRKIIKSGKYEIIHSHYSLSSFVASLAMLGFHKPQIVSLMGSDVNAKGLWKIFIQLFNLLFWDIVIVKSEDMKQKINLKDVYIIPNGVNLDVFISNKLEAIKKEINFDLHKKHIIWVSNPKRKEKNYSLAVEAIKHLNSDDIILYTVTNVAHSEIPKYMLSADVLLLTSFWEGSPNVVKEAMACNISVVSTDVGDVRWLFGNEPGYFITSFEPEDIAEKIKLALDYKEKHGRTNGRQRIIDLGLDSESIAKKIIKVYKGVNYNAPKIRTVV